jgi:hypothetical protein
MSQFFMPPFADCGPATEQAYQDQRDRAEVCTGGTSRERRIEGILCRRKGRDYLLRVGEPDAANGQTVTAIIQLGRDTYTVHHLGADATEPPELVVLRQSDVYSVTDFN